MATKSLRLRNDSPYPGESLSSFLERTALFYGTPFNALLEQLMDGHGWNAKGRPDLDLNPPDVLQSRLADSVSGWRSPLDEHHGFHGWVMAPAQRHAYCPICFGEDLAAGRTPYFRMDWMATFVTICWEHGTPLLEWQYRDCVGHRRLPESWLYRGRKEEVMWPAFFTKHCQLLERLDGQKSDGKGLMPADTFGYLYGLQVAVEKRSAEPMDIYPQAQDPRDDMRSLAKALVMAVAQDICTLYAVSDKALAPAVDGTWFHLRESDIPRYPRDRVVEAIRQTKTLEWRRANLLFAARTLAGSTRYGRAIVADPAGERPWRALWRDDLWRGAGDRRLDVFEQLMAVWAEQLDEPALPGRGFDIGSDRRQMPPTHAWIKPWLGRCMLDASRQRREATYTCAEELLNLC